MRPNIETHYKDITSHFQKADNNLHQSTRIYTNLHEYLHQSARIYTKTILMLINVNPCTSM